MHVQTNASVNSSETSTKLLNADSIFFHWSGPSLMPTRHSAPVSDVDWSLASPFANSNFELLCPTLFSRPLTTSGHVEIAGPKPFVWFRAITDKGIVCLAGHLHSVTYGRKDEPFLTKIPSAVLNNTMNSMDQYRK